MCRYPCVSTDLDRTVFYHCNREINSGFRILGFRCSDALQASPLSTHACTGYMQLLESQDKRLMCISWQKTFPANSTTPTMDCSYFCHDCPCSSCCSLSGGSADADSALQHARQQSHGPAVQRIHRQPAVYSHACKKLLLLPALTTSLHWPYQGPSAVNQAQAA